MDKEAEKKRLNKEIENILAAANREIAMRQGQVKLLDTLLKEEFGEAYKDYANKPPEEP